MDQLCPISLELRSEQALTIPQELVIFETTFSMGFHLQPKESNFKINKSMGRTWCQISWQATATTLSTSSQWTLFRSRFQTWEALMLIELMQRGHWRCLIPASSHQEGKISLIALISLLKMLNRITWLSKNIVIKTLEWVRKNLSMASKNLKSLPKSKSKTLMRAQL